MDTGEKDREASKKIFGETKPLACRGGFEPDMEELRKPFDWPKAVIRFFCRGCGTAVELDQAGAEVMAAFSGIEELPSPLREYYFETEGCISCDPKKQKIEIKKIP